MNFKKYEIILVEFPFSNLSNSKLRPALILKPLEGENIILCQITTKKRGISKYEVFLDRKSCKGKIKFDSNIYLDMLFTLHKSLILQKIGEIKNKKIIEEIDKKVKLMFS